MLLFLNYPLGSNYFSTITTKLVRFLFDLYTWLPKFSYIFLNSIVTYITVTIITCIHLKSHRYSTISTKLSPSSSKWVAFFEDSKVAVHNIGESTEKQTSPRPTRARPYDQYGCYCRVYWFNEHVGRHWLGAYTFVFGSSVFSSCHQC